MTNQDFDMPKPCNWGQKDIDEAGENAAKALDYLPGADLLPIVERLGGGIIYQTFSDLQFSAAGSIEVRGEGDFKIYLATHTSEARDRYTIGHELGHYVLHYLNPRLNGEPIERLKAARYGTDLVEYEANWFAAGFLMPAAKFRCKYNKLDRNIDLVAALFRVSTQACKTRAKVLGLE